MKNLFFTLALTFFSVVIYAQETKTIVPTSIETTVQDSDENAIATPSKASTIEYSRTSKVAFYEALLLENDINIHLNDSDQLAIKSIEQIISKKRNQKLYSELDQE